MNKAFMIKMLRAKHMEYEAVKELMPMPVKHLVEETEEEARGLIKEMVMAYMRESQKADLNENGEQEKKAKKVKVEF